MSTVLWMTTCLWLWPLTYRSHVVRNLGDCQTLILSSSVFHMELATAVTVLMTMELQLSVSVCSILPS